MYLQLFPEILPIDWDIDRVESDIEASALFQSLDYSDTIGIAFRGLCSALRSAQSRLEWYARTICRNRHDQQDVDRSKHLVSTLAFQIFDLEINFGCIFAEIDDNDLTDERAIRAFFAGLSEEYDVPKRRPSVVELVHEAALRHCSPPLSKALKLLPEHLIHAVLAMKYAAWGLYWFHRAAYPDLDAQADVRTEQECRESAILFLADARVAMTKMRMSEVLERAQQGRVLPEKATLVLFEELGIQLQASKKASQLKQKKSDAAKKRRRSDAVDASLIVSAVESGLLQKTVALDFGITEARVSQIMKSHRQSKNS